jgi:hypothetical protein
MSQNERGHKAEPGDLPLGQKTAPGDLPLEYTFDIAKADGILTFNTSIKRGLLCLTFERRMDDQGVIQRGPVSAEAKFKYLARLLRAALQTAGYPSDLEYVWISVAEGEWHYDENRDKDLGGQPYELRSWHDQLVAMTQPLSRYRLLGDLLHMIDQLLRQNLKSEALNVCWGLMEGYCSACIAGGVNSLATRGVMAERCLAKGSESRKLRGTVVLDVVCKHAEHFWHRKAALRGNKTITAEEIASEVNEELKCLGQKPLRPKTIADTIAKGISGGLLRTG